MYKVFPILPTKLHPPMVPVDDVENDRVDEGSETQGVLGVMFT